MRVEGDNERSNLLGIFILATGYFWLVCPHNHVTYEWYRLITETAEPQRNSRLITETLTN